MAWQCISPKETVGGNDDKMLWNDSEEDAIVRSEF